MISLPGIDSGRIAISAHGDDPYRAGFRLLSGSATARARTSPLFGVSSSRLLATAPASPGSRIGPATGLGCRAKVAGGLRQRCRPARNEARQAVVMSGGLSRHGHHLLEARTIDIRQILPLDGVIDHGRHARNTIGERRVGRNRGDDHATPHSTRAPPGHPLRHGTTGFSRGSSLVFGTTLPVSADAVEQFRWGRSSFGAPGMQPSCNYVRTG